MKSLLALLTVSALAAGLYIVSPFIAAWQLREAIRAGDTQTIARKVQWDTVRASLRDSISKQSDLLPGATELGREVKPTVWQRVKNAFGATMLDRFLETYITPEGLPKLATYNKAWRSTVTGISANLGGEPSRESPPWTERLAEFYSRVRRAEFTGLTRAIFEIADRHDPARSYLAVLDLSGFEWKLTSLRIVTTKQTDRLTASTQLVRSN